MDSSVFLNFHGVTARVASVYAHVLEDLKNDFAYFLTGPGESDLSLTVQSLEVAPKGWIPLPRLGRSRFFLSPPGETRVAYFEKSRVVYRFHRGRCEVYSDAATAYEVAYLMLLAYVGEALDRKGIHRIHGLGMTWRGDGMIVLAPSGGGKSTLALELLRSPEMAILSDDVPWVNPRGEILAFPQRIALKTRPTIAPEFVRTFRRVRYGEKFVVGSRYFEQRIVEKSPLRWLVVIDSKRGSALLEKRSRIFLIWPLLRWLVLGLETPQVWEVFVRLTPSDLWAKAKILFSRARLAWRLGRQSQAASFRLSPHVTESGETLKRFTWQTATP